MADKEEVVEAPPKEEPKEEAKGDDLITKAEAVAIRQEEANKVLGDLLDRQEKLRAHEIVSGKAVAGTEDKEEKEETPTEYKDRILAGEE